MCPVEKAAMHLNLVTYGEMTRKGIWPVAGGFLDQTMWWMSWVRHYTSQMQYWEERRRNGHGS